jgi:hypothetical protein
MELLLANFTILVYSTQATLRVRTFRPGGYSVSSEETRKASTAPDLNGLRASAERALANTESGSNGVL